MEFNRPLFIRYAVLGLLFVAFGSFDLSVATMWYGGNGFVRYSAFGIIFGLVFAQMIVIAVWTALGPANVFVRATSGLFLVMLVCLSVYVCMSREFSRDFALAMSGAALMQWLILQIPLSVIRMVFGRRLCWPSEESSQFNRKELQFGIRQLLAWTVFVAVVLGVGRIFMLDDVGVPAYNNNLVGCGMLGAYGSLFAIPIVWAAFVQRGMPLWLVIAAICCVGICVAELFSLEMAIGNVDSATIWLLNGSQFVVAYGSLLLIRLCGFKLVNQTVANNVPA